jgi:hypothetical protein
MRRIGLVGEFMTATGEETLAASCAVAIERVLGSLGSDRLECAKQGLVQKGVNFEITPELLRRIGAEGQITYQPSGKVTIATSGRGNYQRQRFTLAHEIGHFVVRETIFPLGWNTSETRFRTVGLHDNGGRKEEEMLANALAAEILMPAREIETACSMSTPREVAVLVRQLASKFGSSRIATLKRVCDVSDWEAVLLTLIRRRELSPSSEARIDQCQWFTPYSTTRYLRENAIMIDPPSFSVLATSDLIPLHVRVVSSSWRNEFSISQGSGVVATAYALAARSVTSNSSQS